MKLLIWQRDFTDGIEAANRVTLRQGDFEGSRQT